ncbi:MAG TPA: hypothetical protein VFM55_19210 [Micromonosporaceae bacterium]|nr:hypothetical protein [Micromonosporaceae bacterium]
MTDKPQPGEPRIRTALLEFLRSGDNEILSEDDDMPALWPSITLDGDDGLRVEIRGEGDGVAARYRVAVELVTDEATA